MNTKTRSWMSSVAVCGGVVLLGGMDWVTGHELNFFVFYFLPVSTAAWCLGLPTAIAASLLSALVWLLANDWGLLADTTPFFAAWNTGIRLIAFLYIGYTVARMRQSLEREQATGNALRQAMSEIHVLHGILPICAQCKKIRNEQGGWEQMEAFISEHSETRFSHGYCPECAAKFREEAGLPSEEDDRDE